MTDAILIGLMGASGIIIGAIITIIGSRQIAKKNHEYSMEKLREEHEKKIEYLRERIFFKKKLEYFEQIAEAMEESILFHNMAINKLKKNKKRFDVNDIRNITYNSKVLAMQASPLYSDTLKPTAIGIVKFLIAQKSFDKLIEEISKRKLKKTDITKLNNFVKKMMKSDKEATKKMREELLDKKQN